MTPSSFSASGSHRRGLAIWAFFAQLLLLGTIAACGGEDTGEYPCTMPAQSATGTTPATVMGGQIEERSDGSFILVSHLVWGIRHVVLMLGPDLPRQDLISGYIDVVPHQMLRTADGGLCGDVAQIRNDGSDGSTVQLTLNIDTVQGKLRGTLRDHGTDDPTRNISGGPIVGANFDSAGQPSVASVLGDWPLRDSAGRPAELAVQADGSLRLTMPDCSYSGQLEPVSGLNVLDMKLRGAAPCQLDTDETEGFVVLLPLTDGRQQLMLWGVDNGWGTVTQAIGSR